MNSKPLIIAHRGASRYALENTIPAFKLAEELGADFIELDIHMTKDGELVVFHPFLIRNMKIRELTLKEIQGIDVGVLFSFNYRGTYIPTLKEVLKEVNLKVNIEIKGNERIYPGILDKLLEVIEEYPVERFIFSSFDFNILRNLKKKRENAVVEGLCFSPYGKSFPSFLSGINPYFIFVSKGMVDRMHLRSLTVKPYTVNNPLMMKRLIKIGVDGIFTDVPDVLKKVMESEKH
ncbi:MAG: glycerophosphodiester phosphodiesterase [Caldisericia bacterium]|nr:glycerophosphodiester phosphodiesterase [Caldisericia bacterium]